MDGFLFEHKDITLITNDGFVSSKNRYLFVKMAVVNLAFSYNRHFYYSTNSTSPVNSSVTPSTNLTLAK